MVLALVFDVETPFSKIRSQASSLARALASPPSSDPLALPPAPDDVEVTGQPPVALPPLFDDGKTSWRSEHTSVEKLGDDLCGGLKVSSIVAPSSHAPRGEGLKASKPETTLKTRHLTAVLIEDVDRAGVYGGSLRATASARRY
jgi:hypothetical protein